MALLTYVSGTIRNRSVSNIAVATVLFTLALYLRLEYLSQTEVDGVIRGDAVNYISYASNLVEHGIFSKDRADGQPVPDAYWGPGYPAFLSSMYMLGRVIGWDFFTTTFFAQAMLGAMTAVITFALARIFLGSAWGLFCGIVVAISPHLISIGANFLTETFFGALLAGGLLLSAIGLVYEHNKALIASGVVFGLAWLVNPVVLFAPLFVGLAVALKETEARPEKRALRRSAFVMLVLYFAIVSAWMLRNNTVVPEGSSGAEDRFLNNLIVGAHSGFFAIWRNNPRDPANPVTLDQQRFAGSTSEFVEVMMDRISADPGHYAWWYLVEKPRLLFGWDILIGFGDVYVYPVLSSLYHKSKLAIVTYIFSKIMHPWIVVLAGVGTLLGIVTPRNHAAVPATVAGVYLYIALVYIVTQAEPRYSIPLRPETAVLAAFALAWLWDRIRRLKWYARRSVSASAVL